MGGPSRDVTTRDLVVDGVRVLTRRTAGDGAPTLFVHGNPTSSEDWLPFLKRLDRPAIALDLPGWGRSERPGVHRFDHSMHGLGRFVERFLDAAGIDEYQLVCHDWGAVALLAAQAEPERVRRLVVINAVPLLAGYRWHWVARYAWRRRGLGELFNLASSKPALRLISRKASGTPGPMPGHVVEHIWRQRRPGTWPELLTLYRSADPQDLAAAGRHLDRLSCEALVVWGVRDPFLPPRFARAYAERLPNAELAEYERAGHWPWFDRPEVVERVNRFLEA